MALWGINKFPVWKNKQVKKHGVVRTDRGYEDAKTHEVLASVSKLSDRAGPASILSVAFDKDSYAQGDDINVIVTFSERVLCNAPSTLVISSTGASASITATAPILANVVGSNVFVFSAVVPSETAVLSLDAQSILGGIFDALDTRPLSNVAISGPMASSAGSRSIA